MSTQKGLILLSLVTAGLIAYNFLKPLSSIEWAERISGLRIDNKAKTRKFHDGTSFLWGGGLICGEFDIEQDYIQTLSRDAIQNDYYYPDSLGTIREIAFVMQKDCYSNKNPEIRNHTGQVKLFISTAKETRFAALDIHAGKLYVFWAKASDVFD